MTRKSSIILTIVCLLLLAGPYVFHQALLGPNVVSLKSAPAFVGPVSQSLTGSNNPKNAPVFGKDFTLQNTHYFENKDWAVISIKPLNNTLNSSTVVLQKLNGDYRVVLGPGSSFSDTLVSSLPGDVVDYLNYTLGIIYVSAK